MFGSGDMWTFYSLAEAFIKHSKWRMLAYVWRMFSDVRPQCLMCCMCTAGLTAKMSEALDCVYIQDNHVDSEYASLSWSNLIQVEGASYEKYAKKKRHGLAWSEDMVEGSNVQYGSR